MICYDKIDLSEEMDDNKIKNSRERMVCQFLYFDNGFEFQSSEIEFATILKT